MATVVEAYFDQHRMRVVTVDSPEMAIEVCEHEPHIDVAIMDLNFGGTMSGIPGAELLLRRYGVPVVFYSSFIEPEIVEQAAAVSPYGYVAKSAGTAVLLVTVRNAVRMSASTRRLRTIVENMPVMMNAFDTSGTIVAWNRECERVTGYSAADVVGNPAALEMLYPNAAERAERVEQMKLRSGNYRDWEWTLTCKDGSERVVAWSNISRFFPIEGWAEWGVGIDVTQWRRSEQELKRAVAANQALMSELQHRFKNNLALVVSFIQMAEMETENAAVHDALRELRGKITSMAVLYRLLYQHDDAERIHLDGYIKEVAETIIKSFTTDAGRISLRVETCALSVEVSKATPLGLILNEILTNALKYAFPNGQEGWVQIRLCTDDSKRLELTVRNNGVPFPTDFDPARSGGTGVQLMQLLAKQLGGTVQFLLEEQPAIRVRVPL